ncbi:MAG: ATP-binding protein [bacterium]
MLETDDRIEVLELKKAFDLFTSASGKLESAYRHLEDQTEELKRELRDKNAKLAASLHEKERLEEFLEGILQHLPVGIAVTDASGRVRLANRRAEEMTGLTCGELEQSRCSEVPLLADVPLRERSSLEIKRGRATFRCSVSRLNQPVGNGSGWVVMLEDISDVIRWKSLADRQRRLSSMGDMAARIAHEIRNPLGSMELSAAVLLEGLKEGDELHKIGRRLATGVRTMSQTLSNLLHFAKGTHLRRERTDLQALIEEALDFARPLLEEKQIGAELAWGRSPPAQAENIVLWGDRVLLRQALLNLFLNALEAMRPGGRLQVRVEGEPVPPRLGPGRPCVRIRVQDDGTGIPEEDLDRIFDPFFSTKTRGTGLGLAIVHNIVESHGGIIEVESRLGEGTCFILSLPVERVSQRHPPERLVRNGPMQGAQNPEERGVQAVRRSDPGFRRGRLPRDLHAR